MTAMRTSRSTVGADPTSDRSVLVDDGRGLVALPRRRRDAVLARMHSTSLDDKLATGVPPERSRLLAVRAAQLTSPGMRALLARRWDEVVVRAARPHMPYDPSVPASRAQVTRAADEIATLTALLRARRPVSAHGVAIATSLLTRPDSPLYRRGRRPGALAGALVEAVEQM